ncbi:MAG: GTP-binding protein [Methanomassiliicoccales archaeon]|nr:MAG: GTP-binding protein [Methanomassiliicoccales archaeon]
MSEKRVMMKKVCLIGEAAVGKTSLIRRFVFDRFSDTYIATIGTKTSAKELTIKTEKEEVLLKLQIWDIIGLRSFAKLQTHVYQGAKGAFIVTDITRKGTLRTIEAWILSLFKTAGEIPIIILANKNDLKPEFGKPEIEEIIKDYGFPYLFTSAKTGENVNEAFQILGTLMIEPWKGKNILSQLEKSQTLQEDIEPELEPGRALSVFEVEDIIMARYCDLLEDPKYAMAIINEQYIMAARNFKDPTVERLNWIMNNLIKAAQSRVDPARLDREFKAYTSLIERIA